MQYSARRILHQGQLTDLRRCCAGQVPASQSETVQSSEQKCAELCSTPRHAGLVAAAATRSVAAACAGCAQYACLRSKNVSS